MDKLVRNVRYVLAARQCSDFMTYNRSERTS